MSPTVRAVMVATMACALVAACDDAPAPRTEAPASSASKPRDTEALLPPNMVAAVSAGKTASVLGVHFALGSAPTVGKPLSIDIAIVPHAPFTAVRALFEAPEALAMAAGNQFAQQNNVKPESVLTHRLQVRPTQDGVFLITAAVESEGEEGTVTRIYSIPVIVTPESSAATPAANPAQSPASPPAGDAPSPAPAPAG